MPYVLSRDVTADGVKYAVGTPLDQVPAEYRDSLLQTGWAQPVTRYAEPDAPMPISPPSADTPVVADEPEQSTPAIEPPVVAEDEPDDVDSPALDTLAISSDLAALLSQAAIDDRPLRTVADVIAFGALHKGFRVIKGIGKAGNDEIQAALAAL
jgi:hypothetical protein